MLTAVSYHMHDVKVLHVPVVLLVSYQYIAMIPVHGSFWADAHHLA